VKSSQLWISWALLLLLLAIELAASFLPLPRALRPLLLVPAVLMVATIATLFMQIHRGPALVRLFAGAGVLWLIILLTLGALDPLTRTQYLVAAPTMPQ
jgi:cytochrome c oxidase subunit IV